MTDRSNLAGVRNPVLLLPSAQRLAGFPPEVREALAVLFDEISSDARARADRCWRTRKPPMAAYWKSAAVYARHIRIALRRAGK